MTEIYFEQIIFYGVQSFCSHKNRAISTKLVKFLSLRLFILSAKLGNLLNLDCDLRCKKIGLRNDILKLINNSLRKYKGN